ERTLPRPTGADARDHPAVGAVSCEGSWDNGSLDDTPEPRYSHTAVWTGTQMIVWGGIDSTRYHNNGNRYDPATDTWSPVSLAGAPAPRSGHAAGPTGKQMLVWGSWAGSFHNTGGRYDPYTDTWSPASLIGAPAARYFHTAIWTGTQMIVWG